jgi:hypothetical protein
MISVQLFITESCPHCASALQSLTELTKAGDIGVLEINNLAQVPEKGLALDIRSVPWIKIGPFELVGQHSKQELLSWIHRLESSTGMQDYLSELFTGGKLLKVIALIKKEPQLLENFPPMIANPDTPLGAKIGISAVFEDFQGEEILHPLIPALSELLQSEEPAVRNDACYFLGLTESQDAIPAIQTLVHDEREEIRETVHDALIMIQDAQPPAAP